MWLPLSDFKKEADHESKTEITVQTRQNIIDAVWSLCCEKRIEKITVKEIASLKGGALSMEENKTIINTIDEYILKFPAEVQAILQVLRQIIKEAAPEAEEKINYQMPTFYLHGNLVHFAAYKNHIGFYPAPTGIEAFKKELSVYKGAKGSVQFPIDKSVPFELIREIVKYRVNENMRKAEEKSEKKNDVNVE